MGNEGLAFYIYRSINVRPTSTNDGPPTLDIQRPGRTSDNKIRYK